MNRIAAAAAMAVSLLGAGAATAGPLHVFVPGPHGPIWHGPIHHGPIYGGPIHHGPVFGGPVAFGHWGYGDHMPRAWLVPARFVVDFVDYNLAPPPADYQWVQDGSDALLVNLDTGMVVQVVPNAFA